MAVSLRNKVLRAFKNIHKARLEVFKGDGVTLKAAREKINEEFRKNKDLQDKGAINDSIIYADTVAHELRTSVIQAQEKKPGVYQLNVNENTLKLDNKPYDPNAKLPTKKRGNKSSPCCQDFLKESNQQKHEQKNS